MIRFIPDLSKVKLNVIGTLNEQHNWGLTFINTDEAWLYSQGENTKVAVIDTGWQPHKDLQPNFFAGYDATGNNDFIDHGNFHGVHVAGIIAADCGAGVGVKGVAPKAKLVPIKALTDDGVGTYDMIETALQIVLDLDVDVVNMSLGNPIQPTGRVHSLIQKVAEQGKIIVCASGNDGLEVNYPAKYDEVIAVAATQSDGALAKFSSRGPELDLAAPGVKIYSTWGNNSYINLDGTSMAAPCISGMIALIVSWYKQNPDPNFAVNYINMIKLMYDLGESNIIQNDNCKIGVPKLHNFNPWKKTHA